MVCTHGQRDKRCGRIGPLVIKKLRELLAAKNVPETDVAVRATSHIGGHKYAGTLIVYPEGNWYGQMSERNAEDLVDAYLSLDPMTVIAKNWRGKMVRGICAKIVHVEYRIHCVGNGQGGDQGVDEEAW